MNMDENCVYTYICRVYVNVVVAAAVPVDFVGIFHVICWFCVFALEQMNLKFKHILIKSSQKI